MRAGRSQAEPAPSPRYMTGARGSTSRGLLVILGKHSLRGEGSGRGALSEIGRIRGMRRSRRFAWLGACRHSAFLLRLLLAIEVPDNARYVGLRLIVGRHAAVLCDAQRPGIVSRQRLYEVKVVLLQQTAQILGAAFDIGLRIRGG